MTASSFALRLLAVLLCAAVTTPPASATEPSSLRPLTTTGNSQVTGITFSEAPTVLPIDTRFSQSIQTIALDLGLSCGQIEAFGWNIAPNDQARVDSLFTNTAVELNRLGYRVQPQDPAAAAEDITVYTATRADNARDPALFVWSAGDAGLLLLICGAKGDSTGGANTLQSSGMEADTHTLGASAAAAQGPINGRELVGVWDGTYNCRDQGITGGKILITKSKAMTAADEFALEGVLDFFPTDRNPAPERGSYRITGTFNGASQQAYFEPGKWLKQPKGYVAKPIIAYFDVPAGKVSAIFQDTTGCTSFEATYKANSAKEAERLAQPVKKKPKKKKPAPKPVEPPVESIPEPSIDSIAPLSETAPAEPVTVPDAPVTDTPVAEPAPEPKAEPKAETKTETPTAPAAPELSLTPAAPAETPAAPAAEAPKTETPTAAPTAAPTPAAPTAEPKVEVPTVPTGPIVIPNKAEADAAVDAAQKAKELLEAGELARARAAQQLAVPPAETPKADTPPAPAQ